MDTGTRTIEVAPRRKASDWFEGLETIGSVARLNAHERLVLEGELENQVLIVRSGIVVFEWASNRGPRRIGQIFYPGDLIRTAMFPDLPNATLVGARECELLRLNDEKLRDAVRADRLLHARYEQSLASQQARQTMYACALGGLTADARVAAMLIEFACRLGKTQSGRISFDLPLSRTDIADYLALNADTLSRITSRFRALGVLSQVGREKVFILDWKQLLQKCPLSTAIMSLHQTA